MKITAIQMNTRWREPAANLRAAERLMDREPDAGLYVLPEMWNTGFDTAPDADTAEAGRRALAWMQEQATQRGCAVAGTVAVRECRSQKNDAVLQDNGAAAQGPTAATDDWRNRFYFVCPDGTVHHYDKRNLFAPGGEQKVYTAGAERVVVSYGGVRFLLQTCFDLRFPETARNTAAEPYDVLVYAANWPAPRRSAWDALLPARAIENQAYCLGVNRTGSDPQCLYSGGSAAFDPYGRELFRLDEAEQACSFEPDLEALRRFREKFRVLR